MSTGSKRGGGTTVLATIGILLLPAACCAAPLLLGAGVVSAAGILGATGTVLGNPWVIAVAVAAGAIVWLVHRRSGAKRPVADRCVPEKPASAEDATDHVNGHQT